MRYGVAGFGRLCAVLWVLLGFGVFEGHVSSVSGWWGGVGGPLFALTCRNILWVYVWECVLTCVRHAKNSYF